MSGLAEHFPEFAFAGEKVQQLDIDQYVIYEVYAPSIDSAFIGTKNVVAAGTVANLVFKSHLPDYPRNLLYNVTGVAGGMGGTFVAKGSDQFGSPVTETCGLGTAAGGGSVQGTAVFGSVTTITVTTGGLGGTAVGTSSVGFSTVAGVNGNWFGLPVKVGGTADLRTITWINGTVSTAINAGTNFGTLVNVGGTLPPHAFQGTSGVAGSDAYVVTIKTTSDQTNKGVMANL